MKKLCLENNRPSDGIIPLKVKLEVGVGKKKLEIGYDLRCLEYLNKKYPSSSKASCTSGVNLKFSV